MNRSKRSVVLSDKEWTIVEHALMCAADTLESSEWQIDHARVINLLATRRGVLRNLRLKIADQRRLMS